VSHRNAALVAHATLTSVGAMVWATGPSRPRCRLNCLGNSAVILLDPGDGGREIGLEGRAGASEG